jgi:hypothetical protein
LFLVAVGVFAVENATGGEAGASDLYGGFDGSPDSRVDEDPCDGFRK